MLTPAEEAIVVAFRLKTLLPQRAASLPSAPRHLPAAGRGDRREAQAVQTYEIGYVHIDSCELRYANGKLVMFLAIDRVSKFAYVEFPDSAGKMEGSAFLRNVIEVFPYQIHTVLTDHGMAFADLPKNRDGPCGPLPPAPGSSLWWWRETIESLQLMLVDGLPVDQAFETLFASPPLPQSEVGAAFPSTPASEPTALHV